MIEAFSTYTNVFFWPDNMRSRTSSIPFVVSPLCFPLLPHAVAFFYPAEFNFTGNIVLELWSLLNGSGGNPKHKKSFDTVCLH